MTENQALFFQLVLGLQSAAWMMLGKVANPMTDKVETNLEGVKMNIDLLLMLQEKTKDNLTKNEEEFLSNAIQQLQVNYVEEVKKSATDLQAVRSEAAKKAESAPEVDEGEKKKEKDSAD